MLYNKFMMEPSQIKVLKASGEWENFSEDKVRNSLAHAGADSILIDKIITHIGPELYDGISTHQIYSHIFDLLKKEKSHLITRYNLKRAICELGPTGYPFEKFVAGVLDFYGYHTQVNQIMKGNCVEHEIDIVAQKDGKKLMIECKFHQKSGEKVDIKTALYVYARFLDVRQRENFNAAWLVTNTKVSADAIDYGICTGLKVISWNYPSDFSLSHLIAQSNLHPITVLEDLSAEKKKELLEKGVVFVKDLRVD